MWTMTLAALALSTGSPECGAGAAVPVAEIHAHHVYVDARVEGRAARLILDTGASTTLDSAFLAQAGVATRPGETGEGAGEGTVAVRHADVAIGLGDAQMRDTGVAVVALSQVARAEGRRVDGILGGTLFGRCVVVIDYAGGTVRLVSPSTYRPPAGWTPVPLQRGGDLVFARAALTPGPGAVPVTGWYEIDTGGGHALILNAPFVRRHALAAGAATDTAAMVSIGGAARAVHGSMAWLRLGGRTFSDVPALLSAAASGMTASAEFDGNIGGALLERMGAVAFDYPHRRMWVAPPAHVPPA